jgi:branched-chain amino acid transport system ATP-binding protein
MTEAPKVLEARDLQAFYGESKVLHGVALDVAAGEVVTLLGRNGAGKTTTLKAIMGLVPRREGSILFEGRQLIGLPANEIARAGIAYCPEERGIFSSLNVEENLMLPPRIRAGGMSVPEIFELFPNLKERAKSQGTVLSGGEQQMLAIGRILRTGSSPAAAGRANRRPRPCDCRENRQGDSASEAARFDDLAGRTKRALRPTRRRSALHRRTRPCDRRDSK